VWDQELNKQFSGDTNKVCRFIHGHRAKVIVYLKSGTLANGMVTDFKHLNWFKDFLNKSLDHRLHLYHEDPIMDFFKQVFDLVDVGIVPANEEGDYDIFNSAKLFNREKDRPHIFEFIESIVMLKFNPTAENYACWFYHIIEKYMNPIPNVWISGVDFYETPNCFARYGDV
jgi:6-pyruvoyltetrahydropterin/6-carboxytetrahydropterin synthase